MLSTIKLIKQSEKNPETYYGFINSVDSGKDYYFSKTHTNNLSIDELEQGMSVEFDVKEEDGKRAAINIVIATNKAVENNANVVVREAATKEVVIRYHEYEKKLLEDIERISSITSADDFEDAVYLLIRLLGIHTAYQFDRKNQAGKADGFFILENLAVMYDCTLIASFSDYKEEQIDNYVNKLSQKSQITLEIRKPDGGTASKTIQISGKKRQVWIITRGTTKELTDYDGIKVKEISVTDLASIFSKRVKDWSYDIDRLSSDLTLLGN